MKKTKAPPTKPYVDPLSSWHELQRQIHSFTEEQVQELIDRELAGERRRHMVMRLHMKMNKLRYGREREVLLSQTSTVRTGSVA